MTPLWVLADTVLLLVCWEGLQAHGQQLGTTIITNIQRQSWVEIKDNLLLVALGWLVFMIVSLVQIRVSHQISSTAMLCPVALKKSYNAVILCKASEENYNVVVTYFLIF